MRSTALMLAVLLLAGCHAAPKPPAETRPEWSGAAVYGLAPLMTPRAVEAALRLNGFEQVACSSTAKLLTDPLNHGIDIPCYRSATRPMEVSLYLLDLKEGRRLAVVYFRAAYDADSNDAERLAASRDFARRVRARFGPPFTTSKSSAFQTYYWKRPGGEASLPDMLNTTVGANFPPNLTMTSMWAYGQQRPSP